MNTYINQSGKSFIFFPIYTSCSRARGAQEEPYRQTAVSKYCEFTGRTNHAKIRLHSDGDVNPDIQDTYLDTTGAAIEDGGLTVSSTGSTGLPTRTTRRETTLVNLALNRR